MAEPFKYEPKKASVYELEQAHVIDPPPWPNPRKTYPFAQAMKERLFSLDGLDTLVYLGKVWHVWDGRKFARVPTDDDLRQVYLYKKLETAYYEKTPDRNSNEVVKTEVNPDSAMLARVIDPLKGLVMRRDGLDERHMWIQDTGRGDLPKGGLLIPMANGILDANTRKMYDHTPNLVATWVLPFDYDKEAACPHWKKFVGGILDEDKTGQTFLQEWIGYLISGQTRAHKAVLVTGAPRSGKGVMASVIRALMGEENTAATTLTSLGGRFGLANLEGKNYAFISDSRDSNMNAQATERLLSIIANDVMAVEPKGKDIVTRRLNVRLMIFSNNVPRFPDSGNAIGTRFICLDLPHSHVGKEDQGLTERLLGELPGILNWALDGLDRLRANGWKFTTLPGTHAGILETVNEQASPLTPYVRERLQFDPNAITALKEVYNDYKEWCEEGNYKVSTKGTFKERLKALRLDGVKVLSRTKVPSYDKLVDAVRGAKLNPRSGAAW
ncbi:DNA primase family protein [Corynebacterium glucuronolyticum]|uniref:DNA primase family protein n=1 Tax=Corynebacterium glucuronolyticum TaxID=39791 RepID=UPI00019C2158|nr:phage/plasmid primase, P4 family [Corynebacterium glucuronolyticum]EEI27914.1 phage/plasmid primase, P4 family domain protein [Corynebacterium glucuronolyticum ATCC 51867]QRO81959.1 DNA primase [Corynebacterium glucuronolyticum]